MNQNKHATYPGVEPPNVAVAGEAFPDPDQVPNVTTGELVGQPGADAQIAEWTRIIDEATTPPKFVRESEIAMRAFGQSGTYKPKR